MDSRVSSGFWPHDELWLENLLLLWILSLS